MISELLLINQKGDQIISRSYRGDVPKASVEAFRTRIIGGKDTGTKPPVLYMENTTFMYARHANLYLVAVARNNPNAALVFEFLYQKIRILKAYLGDDFDENAIRNNFTLLYELFDETMDFGYPQNCSVDVLRLYINLGNVQNKDETQQNAAQLTSQITGAIDWRREGIKYRKNEAYIDVLESVNLLLSTNGTVLRNDVTGQVIMKSMLSGMPECKFGLNDKLIMDKEGNQPQRGRKHFNAVEIDDCTFHRCVRLGKFDAERTITFIPPDGEFELMRYRVKDNITLPFKIIPTIQEEGRTRVTIHLKLQAVFGNRTFANNVVVKIPTPPNTANSRITTARGRARYEPEHKAIVWRIRNFPGGVESFLTAEVDLVASLKAKPWSRPPISMEFQVPSFTASGVQVRFLKVYDKSGYQCSRWVRYITRAGDYEVRI